MQIVGIKAPKGVVVDNVEKYMKAKHILDKHGYVITSFSNAGINFYKSSSKHPDGTVPIHSWYFFSHKEFSLLTEILNKVNMLDGQVNEYKNFVEKIKI